MFFSDPVSARRVCPANSATWISTQTRQVSLGEVIITSEGFSFRLFCFFIGGPPQPGGARRVGQLACGRFPCGGLHPEGSAPERGGRRQVACAWKKERKHLAVSASGCEVEQKPPPGLAWVPERPVSAMLCSKRARNAVSEQRPPLAGGVLQNSTLPHKGETS